jgi:hypothetical protein
MQRNGPFYFVTEPGLSLSLLIGVDIFPLFDVLSGVNGIRSESASEALAENHLTTAAAQNETHYTYRSHA